MATQNLYGTARYGQNRYGVRLLTTASGTGSFAPSLSLSHGPTLSVAGSASLSPVISVNIAPAAVSLSGTATLSGTVYTDILISAVSLDGIGGFTPVIADNIGINEVLAGIGTFSATVEQYHSIGATFAGQATSVPVIAVDVSPQPVGMGGVGTITPQVDVLVGINETLSGTAGIVPYVDVLIGINETLAATGSFNPFIRSTIPISATYAATGTFSLDQVLVEINIVTGNILAATSTFTVDTVMDMGLTASMSGLGSMTAAAATVAFSTSGDIDASRTLSVATQQTRQITLTATSRTLTVQ